jgi:hypothetical protein
LLLAVACGTDRGEPARPLVLRTPVEFRRVTANGSGPCPAKLTKPAGGALLVLSGNCLAVGPAEITVTQVSSAGIEPPLSEGPVSLDEWHVRLRMTPEQRPAWAVLTEQAAGQQVAIVAGGRAYAAPVIEEAIDDGTFQIYAESEAEARALAALLGVG